MCRSFLITLGGFFLLSLIVAYLVPDAAGVWPLLDQYAHFISTLVPMIRRIEVLSVRLDMAPSYYFSLMWPAALALYWLFLPLPHDYFVSPEKARSKLGFVTLVFVIVIPLANLFLYFLPTTTPGRVVTVLTVSRSGLAISGWVHISAFILMLRLWWAWFRQWGLIYRSQSGDQA